MIRNPVQKKSFSTVKVIWNENCVFVLLLEKGWGVPPFFAEDMGDGASLAKWSSLDLLTEEMDETASANAVADKNGK